MATLDFGILGLNQPTPADRFLAGQQEAQRNALAQQQLQHLQQQNRLLGTQTLAAQRAEERANRLPQILSGMPAAATVPEQVDVLTRAGFIPEARQLAESHAKAEADRRAAESANLKNQFDTLKLMGQVLSAATDEPSYRMAREQAKAISPQFAAALPDAYDPTRLKSIINQGVDLEKRIADETARRGQDITASTALRGQDITAATAAARMAFEQQKFNWEKANPGYEIKETPQGLVAINKRNPADTRPVMMGGTPVEGAKALTEAQGKATGYALRAKESHDVLKELGTEWSPVAVTSKQMAEQIPGVGGLTSAGINYAMGRFSPASQRAEQAQREFVNAVMRQESGAAISASEFENARKQYFPQPGDSPKVVEQKAKNRETAIRSLEIAAGPGLRQPKQVVPASAAAPSIQDQADAILRGGK